MIPAFKTKSIIQFDRSILKRKWKRINNDPIRQAGIKVMLNARQSIRAGKSSKKKFNFVTGKPQRLHSRPGSPPKYWDSRKQFKMIFAAPNDSFGTSTIVGMVGFGGAGQPTPELIHDGGTARRSVLVSRSGGREKGTGRFQKKRFYRVKKRVKYSAHPFMDRALDKAKRNKRMAKLWEGSLK